MRTTTRLRLAAGVLALATLAAGCGGYDDTTVPPPQVAATTDEPAAPERTCDNEDPARLESYAPRGDYEDGAAVDRIRRSGRLVAGVAADSYLLGSRNPFTGRIEGFDIDMVDQVARRIFGEDGHVVLKVITPDQRFELLESGDVDLVSRNVTITCDRWERVAFSTEYLRSGQKVLAGRDSGIETIADLAGKRVCAPTGTTSIDNIRTIAPKAITVTATDDSECLVKFQNGEADALSTDDTVLAGLAAQDPYAVVLDTKSLTEEPYGIATNSADVDLVMLINDTLEQMRRDGSWQDSYDRWLAGPLGPAEQPPALYGR